MEAAKQEATQCPHCRKPLSTLDMLSVKEWDSLK